MKVSHDRCGSSDACRQGFGMGFVCASSGLCEPQAVPPRVVRTFPVDLLASPEAYGAYRVVGTIVDYTLETHWARADSVIMAIEAANDAGGVTDADGGAGPLAVIVMTNEPAFAGDQLTQLEASVDDARALVEIYGARVIVGPPSSSATTAVFQDLATLPEQERPTVISMSATSSSLTDLEPPATDQTPGLLWRTAPPDITQAATIVSDMQGRALTSIAIVYEQGPYGDGLATSVQAGFEAGGGSVVVFSFSSPSTRDDVIGLAGGTGVDEVLFVSSQTDDSVRFLGFANSSTAYDTETLFLTDGAANSDLLLGIGGVSPSVYSRVRGTRPAPPSGPVYDTFRSSFNARNPGYDADTLSYTAHSYDAGWLAVYGTAWAIYQESAFAGRAVAHGLRHLSAGPSFQVRAGTWPSIREAFRAGDGVDVMGASGDLDYDPVTEETTGPIELWCIVDASGSLAIVACP